VKCVMEVQEDSIDKISWQIVNISVTR